MDNTPKIRQMLTESIFEVFEKMFYTFLEPRDSECEAYRYRASIDFGGPFQGNLAVFSSHSLSESMVRNMLNIEEGGITENLRGDCLKEAVNMICGNFLRKVDSASIFDLSLPTFEAGTTEIANYLSASAHTLRLDFTAGAGESLALIMDSGGI